MHSPPHLKIIIADDHPVVLLGASIALKSFFEPDDCIIVEASCTGSLLNLLNNSFYDLVITDLSMPGGSFPDGLTLISHIRKHFEKTKIIIMTMINNKIMLRKLLNLGISGAIDKHRSLNELDNAVASVLKGKRYVSSSFSALLETAKIGEIAHKSLSAKELEVMRLYGQGLGGREIAKRLNRSEKTISRQKRTAMHKLGLRSLSELAANVHLIGVGYTVTHELASNAYAP